MIDPTNIADFACLDPVYVDDCGGAVNLGTNLNLMFFRYVPVIREGAPVRFERTPCLSLVMPLVCNALQKPAADLFCGASA